MLCKKGVPKNFANFTGKNQFQSLFFNKVARLMPATLLKKRLWLRPATLLKKRLLHRCFPVNFAKFLRTPFLTEYLRWMLLTFSESWYMIHPDTSETFFASAHSFSTSKLQGWAKVKFFVTLFHILTGWNVGRYHKKLFSKISKKPTLLRNTDL